MDGNSNTNESILLVVDSIYPAMAGAEKQVSTISKFFIGGGRSVNIVAVRRPNTERMEYIDDVPVWRVGLPFHIRGLSGLAYLTGIMWFLFRHRNLYSVVHIQKAHYTAAVATVVTKLLRKRILVKVTGYSEIKEGVLNQDLKGPRWSLMRAILRHANFQATSSEIGQRLSNAGVPDENVFLIPNAVDVQRFPAQAAQHPLAPRVAVFLGRLVPEKGLEVFLQAWNMSGCHNQFTLLVAGDGQSKDSLLKLVSELNLEQSVTFLGGVSDVPALLAQAHVAVLPSYFEGLSNSLLEYMAASLPVIGSAVSGTTDLVKIGETGWIFPPGDIEACSSAITQMCDTSGEDLAGLGANARAMVSDHASTRVVLEKLTRAYGFSCEDDVSCVE